MRMLVVLLLMCVPCTAQTNASLELVVKDPSGSLIDKAYVQLIKNGKIHSVVQTNAERRASTK